MVDKLGYRISNLDIACNDTPVPAAKYSIDTSLFDTLVDKANNNSNPADEDSADAPSTAIVRTLKQRLTQCNDDDVKFLADLLDRRLTEDRGELLFEVGNEADGSSMDLTDDDIAQ
ncbi:hypothetical protein GGI00_003011, partial [Coemansia sp. RSA 2681]